MAGCPPPLHVGGKQLTCAPIRHRILLDDFLLLFDSFAPAHQGVRYAKALLAYLGLKANEKKSSWEPRTKKMHLGLYVDTAKGCLRSLLIKLTKSGATPSWSCQEVGRNARWVPGTHGGSHGGPVSLCLFGFLWARPVAHALYASLKGKGSLADKVKLSNQAVKDVKVLANFPKRWNGAQIWDPPPPGW